MSHFPPQPLGRRALPSPIPFPEDQSSLPGGWGGSHRLSKKAWTIFPRIGLNSRSGMLSKFSFLQRGQRQSEGDGEEGEALIDSTPSFHSNHGKIEILDKNSFFFLFRLRASLCSGIFMALWEALGMMLDFRVFPGKKASNRAQQGTARRSCCPPSPQPRAEPVLGIVALHDL